MFKYSFFAMVLWIDALFKYKDMTIFSQNFDNNKTACLF